MHDACTKLNYAKEASFIFVVMLCYFEASGGKSHWHGENRRLHVSYDERVEEMEKRKRKGKAWIYNNLFLVKLSYSSLHSIY